MEEKRERRRERNVIDERDCDVWNEKINVNKE
jgi:hypothetical protein